MGGTILHGPNQSWKIRARPPNHGWFTFRIEGRTVHSPVPTDPLPEILRHSVRGYLVGDRLVSDQARVDPDPFRIGEASERVHLLDLGLERFARIRAGRVYPEGPLIFQGQEMPMGPEDDVLRAYMDRTDTHSLKGITPALEAAFRMECWHRQETERLRQELEARRVEEERLRQLEERRQELVNQLGSAQGRREMAKHNFGEAARAALAVSGATLLDHRRHVIPTEWVVRYRFIDRRFECICDDNLRIVDAGVCLRDERTGVRGDSWLTLESLPGVIAYADRLDRLVVFRHV